MLGGVKVEHRLGLEGHSDADVLVHAICDALLGAAGAGDIGRHFPDTDERYRGISSLVLLHEVVRLVGEKGFDIANIDATVVLERPRLASIIPLMVETLARATGVAADRINVKATTNEKLGPIGREEGIAALAVVSVSERGTR